MPVVEAVSTALAGACREPGPRGISTYLGRIPAARVSSRSLALIRDSGSIESASREAALPPSANEAVIPPSRWSCSRRRPIEFMGCDGWPSRVSGLRHTKNFHVVQAKQGERRGIGHSRVLVETFSTTSILHRPILPHVCIVQLHSPTVTRLGSRACRASAGTKALLRLTRSHRRIENGLH